jgi:hypothetical protein
MCELSAKMSTMQIASRQPSEADLTGKRMGTFACRARLDLVVEGALGRFQGSEHAEVGWWHAQLRLDAAQHLREGLGRRCWSGRLG